MAGPQRTSTAGLVGLGGLAALSFHQEKFTLPARRSAVTVARRRVRSRLPLWGYREDVCDAAELVVSELFTNAIVHTASEHVRCLLRAEEERLLYVEVADQGGGPVGPTPRDAGVEDESGRGLVLVSAIAEKWGDRPGPDGGRMVWALLRGSA